MDNITRKFSNNILQIILIIIFLFLSNLTTNSFSKPKIQISKQDSAFNLNPQFVDFFSLGYRRFITAFVWVSTILESDHEHYKIKDSNSWMFLRFDLISKLDPFFYENYLFGGQYLSIIKDDDIGAQIIFERGLSKYPDQYELLLHAGFHYLYELKDYEKAIPIYNKLQNFPELPRHIRSVYARLSASKNDYDVAFSIVYDLYFKNRHVEFFEKRYRNFLYAIKAEKDLTCLNSHEPNCGTKDFDGNPYILKNGKFYALKEWIPFRFDR